MSSAAGNLRRAARAETRSLGPYSTVVKITGTSSRRRATVRIRFTFSTTSERSVPKSRVGVGERKAQIDHNNGRTRAPPTAAADPREVRGIHSATLRVRAVGLACAHGRSSWEVSNTAPAHLAAERLQQPTWRER